MKLANMFRLTRMICSYWVHWMALDNDTVNWGFQADYEGLGYYDGWNATFWYLLNVEWYRMNDKQFAYTGCTDRYDELRDFYSDYLDEHFPI